MILSKLKFLKILFVFFLMGCDDPGKLDTEIEALNKQSLEQLRISEEYRQSSFYDAARITMGNNQAQKAAAQGEEAVKIQKDLLVRENALREEIRKIKLELEKCLN